ncbi:unnamed protein product [Prorocentrum cordatum]|uniref:Ribosomal protein L37 n=1 Tax=Prorocentrum cordatum TaxID=2364126 RepID=A0ABN9U7J2_9DINO|nr:unnamed protein product [Polarella glacialis]
MTAAVRRPSSLLLAGLEQIQDDKPCLDIPSLSQAETECSGDEGEHRGREVESSDNSPSDDAWGTEAWGPPAIGGSVALMELHMVPRMGLLSQARAADTLKIACGPMRLFMLDRFVDLTTADVKVTGPRQLGGSASPDAAPKWRLPKRAADGEAAGAPALGNAKAPPPRQGGGATSGFGGPNAAASGPQENAVQDKGDKKNRNRHLGKVKDMGFNKKQAAFINVMVKQVLLTSQMVRDLWAAGVDTFFMDADAPEVVAVSECGVTYSHEVRARGKGHQLGPPHLHIFDGFLSQLLERGVALGRLTRARLKLWHDKAWVELRTDELYDIMRLFRVMKCYDQTKRKRHIMRRDVPMDQPSPESDEQPLPSPIQVRGLLQKALVEAGARRALGAAPPGAMEEIMQNAVDGKEVPSRFAAARTLLGREFVSYLVLFTGCTYEFADYNGFGLAPCIVRDVVAPIRDYAVSDQAQLQTCASTRHGDLNFNLFSAKLQSPCALCIELGYRCEQDPTARPSDASGPEDLDALRRPAMGKKHKKSHGLCPRCGKRSFHLQKKKCAACGYPASKIRSYEWSKKAKRRRAPGTGRMSYLKTMPRRFKNGFRSGTTAPARKKTAAS